jgi:hypothetical protein
MIESMRPQRDGGAGLISEQMAFLLIIPADQFGVENRHATSPELENPL